MSYPHRRLLLCRAAVVDAVNALYAKHIDKDGAGEFTFSVPLKSGDPKRIRFYAADTSMTRAQWREFQRVFSTHLASGDVRAIDSRAGRAAVKARLETDGHEEGAEDRGKYRTRSE